MEILKYIGFIKTTVTGGAGKWQLSPADTVPSIVISDVPEDEDEQNCVSNDSGICADLCYLVNRDEVLVFLSDKKEEWERLRSRLR